MREKQFHEDVRIPSYLCGPDDHLGFEGVASLLQEAAWQHAQHLGVSFTEEGVDFYWVLHRLGLRFLRRPRWNETVHITTWPSGMERLYALRDFMIESTTGEALVHVSSAWIILNAARGRPERPERHLPREWILDTRVLDLPTGKTPTIAESRVAQELGSAQWNAVRPSDTDRNLHVNNARYAQWLKDAASETLKEEPSGMLTFTNETKRGQEYAVVLDQDVPAAEVWVRNKGADDAVCACRYNRFPD